MQAVNSADQLSPSMGASASSNMNTGLQQAAAEAGKRRGSARATLVRALQYFEGGSQYETQLSSEIQCEHVFYKFVCILKSKKPVNFQEGK